MNPAPSNPDTLGFLGSLGASDARNIIAVFVFLAAALAFYSLWRKQRDFRRLDEAIKLHEETMHSEAPAAVGSGALRNQVKKDVWTN